MEQRCRGEGRFTGHTGNSLRPNAMRLVNRLVIIDVSLLVCTPRPLVLFTYFWHARGSAGMHDERSQICFFGWRQSSRDLCGIRGAVHPDRARRHPYHCNQRRTRDGIKSLDKQGRMAYQVSRRGCLAEMFDGLIRVLRPVEGSSVNQDDAVRKTDGKLTRGARHHTRASRLQTV